MINLKYKLPNMNYYSYKILIDALKYYCSSSVEFNADAELINEIYQLIDYIENKSQVIQGNDF